MLVSVLVLECIGTLCAFEFHVVKNCHNDSVHFLETSPLIAVRTLILAQNHTVCLVPIIEALLAIQGIALFALLRFFNNIVADAAGERHFEGLLRGHFGC